MLRRNSFVFKVTYGLTPESAIPAKINRCRLFWRFVAYFFIICPIYYIVVGIVLAICSVIVFLFTQRIAFLEKDPKDALFVHFKKWPRIKGHRVYPITILLIALLVWAPISYYAEIWVGFAWIFYAVTSNIFLFVVGALVLVSLLIYGIRKFLKSETGQFIKDCLADTKKKACPIIPIEPAPKKE